MSGIFGIVSTGTDKSARLDAMSRVLVHRGPDDKHQYINARVALGCRRLCIQDIDHGRQPLSNRDGTVWIVLNGEIYNCDKLRPELEQKGYIFQSRNDAEVVLHLYEELGVECVEHLRGMFAFAIWDERLQLLMLARDHLGQKPLYFADTNDGFYFASEQKALTAACSALCECDYESLFHYLSLRFVPAPATMLRGVSKLNPAHLLTHKMGRTEISRYWRLNFSNKIELSGKDYINGLEQKLQETVSSHLVGDEPIGAFLSGGLDSSLIVAMMAKALKDQFCTFSVGVRDPKFNELPYARAVAQNLGTRHFETNAEIDVIRSLATIIWHLDEPSDPVAAGKYLASRLAAKHTKVVLGGDGGDELFAGFDRYRGVQLVGHYAHLPAFVRNTLIGSIVNRMPASFAYNSISQKLQWVNRIASVDGVAERFAEAVAFFRFRNEEKMALFTPEICKIVRNLSSNRLIVSTLLDSDAVDPIEKMLYADYVARLPEHSLMLTDRLSMAHGLEVRSPLVDKELVEFVAAFPLRMKIRRGQSKYAERMLAKRVLPRIISKRAKRGFRFPLSQWFAQDLFPFLKAVFVDSELALDGIVHRDYILRLLEEHRRQHTDHHVKIWMLLNLEIWYRLTIQQAGYETVSLWLEKHLKKAKTRFVR